jgi:phospholipase C
MEQMGRRDFVKAGLAFGGAVALGATALPRLSSNGSSSTTPPPFRSVLEGSPAESGIDTVVVCMMENRSFDSHFGWLAQDAGYLERGRSRYGRGFHVDGTQSVTYLAPDGMAVETYRRVTADDSDPWRGCGHSIPGHSWDEGRAQRDGGFLARGSGNDIFGLSYFDGADLPVYHELARRFTVCDRWHASLLGPTFPNREYLLSAQSGGKKGNAHPDRHGFPWDTVVDRSAAAGVPVAEYYSDVSPLAMWGKRMLPFLRPVSGFFDDAEAGSLPNVSFLAPTFIGQWRTDDHPLGDPRAAQDFVQAVFAAFARSPQWNNGLFVLTYDEWGGFFDHVPPPRFADDRASDVDADDFSRGGFRVPALLCSPRAPAGFVDHTTYEHTSVLRFVEWRFLGAPAQGPGGDRDTWFLTRRDRYAANLGLGLSSEDFDPDPRFDLDAAVPSPSPSCGTGTGGTATSEPTAFEALEQSGYFEQLGVPRPL